MNEVELKFQIPTLRRKAVDAAVSGRLPQRRQRLQAAYVDTPGRALAQAGMALRVRREGRNWVQTLKGAASGGLTRFEHNVPRGSAALAPPADPSLHAGTPLGERLLALLAEQPQEPLSVVYRTDILRRTRLLRTRQGTVELAFDEGAIAAGSAQLPVCELEIELKIGSPDAVIETARRWLPRYGLWLDTRTKAERGDLLARGERRAPRRLAQPGALRKQMTAAEAWGLVVRSCAEQITANASQVATGEHDAEHVHQLRVGLRRLRSALRLFAGLHADPGWDEAAATLFRRLGSSRDGAVIEAEFSAELRAALKSTGAGSGTPVPTPAPADAAPEVLLRSPQTQALLLDLLAAASAELAGEAGNGNGNGNGGGNVNGIGIGNAKVNGNRNARLNGNGHAAAFEPIDSIAPATRTLTTAAVTAMSPGPALRDQLGRRMKSWHRRAAAEALRFDELDIEARHRLRKRIKRLRYGLEFCAALFPSRAVRRYLRPLRALQERLGQINDVAMAMSVYSGTRDTDPHAWFALGWLAARRDALVRTARADLKAFAKVRPFWK